MTLHRASCENACRRVKGPFHVSRYIYINPYTSNDHFACLYVIIFQRIILLLLTSIVTYRSLVLYKLCIRMTSCTVQTMYA